MYYRFLVKKTDRKLITNAHCLFINLLKSLRRLEKSVICRYLYFRYLSRSSQISVSCVLDICYLRIRYHKKLQPL